MLGQAEKQKGLRAGAPAVPSPTSLSCSGSQIWLMALCLVLVFTVTLSVFPAITAMVTSSTSPGKWSECGEWKRAAWRGGGKGSRHQDETPTLPQGQFFNPICCFLIFNIMDWLGRSLTSYFLWVSTCGLGWAELVT